MPPGQIAQNDRVTKTEKILRWILAFAMMAVPAQAEGLDIAAALTGTMPGYADGTAQSFAANGETVFTATDGAQSIGHWRMEGGRYCSVWPPSDHWAWYDVKVAGCKIDFVADDGSVAEATMGKRRKDGAPNALPGCHLY